MLLILHVVSEKKKKGETVRNFESWGPLSSPYPLALNPRTAPCTGLASPCLLAGGKCGIAAATLTSYII
jgi:hypothetical protein